MKALRQTILNDYDLCPRKCLFSWGEVGQNEIKQNDEVSNKFAEFGKCVHRVMEYMGNEQIKGRIPHIDEILEYYSNDFNSLPNVFKDDKDKANYMRNGINQITWYYKKLIELKPIAVEWNFKDFEFVNGMLPFTGTIDRIDGDIHRKYIVLRDFKTGKMFDESKLKINYQAAIYAKAIEKHFGILPERFEFLFGQVHSTQTIMITQEFIDLVTSKIITIYTNMQYNVFPPNYNERFCKSFCEYYHTSCDYKEKRKERKRTKKDDNQQYTLGWRL